MFSSNLILILVISFTSCISANVDIPEESLENSDNSFLAKSIYSGINNKYLLFTRNNPDVPQSISYGLSDTLENSNYDAAKELVVIVHGWGGNVNSPVNAVVMSSYLKTTDVNIIVADWGIGHERYISACLRVPSTGRHLGNFIEWVLETTGGKWDSVHLIGYSLGAHIVGIAGRQVGGLPKKITGLDPAGPLWGFNSYSLGSNDGQYVEVIHTNLVGRGVMRAVGDVDFYPNGGRMQPGCSDVACSHDRAYELLASSIENNHLVGRKCSSVALAIVGACFGDTLVMGNTDLSKTGNGIYFLSTKDTWPF